VILREIKATPIARAPVGVDGGRMSHDEQEEPHRGSYRDVVIHKLMLQDVVRTSAYADAIRAVVGPGSRVIDFGTGTGVMAIFAARSGAGRVDAIERTAIVEYAREIAVRSGCPEIVFHRGDQDSFHADDLADVIVSEWMGHFLFFESMMEPLIALRNRWLKPGGIMVPARVSLFAALVVDEDLYEDGAFLERQPYAIDFGPIADLPLRQSRMIDVEEHQVLAPYLELGTLDMHVVSRTPERLCGETVVSRSATVYGIVGWFDAVLGGGIELRTGPSHQHTHWRPLYFPFPEPFECSPERPVTIEISPPRDVEAREPTWAWGIDDAESSIFVDERDSFARCRNRA
jgi:SAM-dependent methyltransferase